VSGCEHFSDFFVSFCFFSSGNEQLETIIWCRVASIFLIFLFRFVFSQVGMNNWKPSFGVGLRAFFCLFFVLFVSGLKWE
jgi:hypothetical protein